MHRGLRIKDTIVPSNANLKLIINKKGEITLF